ncbi:MAG: hypothetical protein Q9207_005712 [Kuettlingeria erythrocarpa]
MTGAMTMATASSTPYKSRLSPCIDPERTIPSETPPATLSQTPAKCHRSNPPWGDLLKEMPSPDTFKKELLRTLPWDGLAGYPLDRYHHGDIPVMVYKHTTYYLRPDDAVLHHQPPPGEQAAKTFYNQLFYNRLSSPTEEKEGPSRFIHADRVSGDYFLPLGSLVEGPNDGKKKRLTNYCWALNISTDPVSLWLAFDYVKTNFVGDDTNVDLSEIYLNHGNEYRGFPYTFERVLQLPGYLGLGSAWDVLKVFDDVDRDWQPESVQAAKLDGAQRWELGPSLRAYALKYPPTDSPGLRAGKGENS